MYARILVPIDGSGTAERGLDEAIALARRLGSTLRILHVADARMLGAAGFAYAPPEQVVDDGRLLVRGPAGPEQAAGAASPIGAARS